MWSLKFLEEKKDVEAQILHALVEFQTTAVHTEATGAFIIAAAPGKGRSAALQASQSSESRGK